VKDGSLVVPFIFIVIIIIIFFFFSGDELGIDIDWGGFDICAEQWCVLGVMVR
jgi:hypothetical protein